jgi:hypothetical protein
LADFPVAEFFEDTVMLTTATYGSASITGHYFNESQLIQDTHMRLISFIIKESDLSTIVINSQLTIGGVVHYVQDIQPDGAGIIELSLSKVTLA